MVATKTDMLQASGAGAPSSRYINLTLGASGSTYTAPANGWFTMNAVKPNAGQVILECTPKHIGGSRYVPAGGSFVTSSSLVQAGDIVTLAYDGTISFNVAGTGFWFVYAEGSKEE